MASPGRPARGGARAGPGWRGGCADHGAWRGRGDTRRPWSGRVGLRERYDLLGYDVADYDLLGGLTNCGYTPEEAASLAPVWAPILQRMAPVRQARRCDGVRGGHGRTSARTCTVFRLRDLSAGLISGATLASSAAHLTLQAIFHGLIAFARMGRSGAVTARCLTGDRAAGRVWGLPGIVIVTPDPVLRSLLRRLGGAPGRQGEAEDPVLRPGPAGRVFRLIPRRARARRCCVIRLDHRSARAAGAVVRRRLHRGLAERFTVIRDDKPGAAADRP